MTLLGLYAHSGCAGANDDDYSDSDSDCDDDNDSDSDCDDNNDCDDDNDNGDNETAITFFFVI